MNVDKNKFSTLWRYRAKRCLDKKLAKAKLVMHHIKRDKALGQPVIEILRLMKAYPNRFSIEVVELDKDAWSDLLEISIFDKTAEVNFHTVRSQHYRVDDCHCRLCWSNNRHSSDTQPWLKEEELDALSELAMKMFSEREELKRKEQAEKERIELEKGRREMMKTYNVEEK